MIKYPSKKYILAGIPIIFIFGSAFHFLFNLSNNNFIIGLICPINESIWEHTKMVLVPIAWYWVFHYNIKVDCQPWLTAMVGSIVTSITCMLFLYYFYTGAFGIEILLVDILILLISIICGQIFGLHLYDYSNGISTKKIYLCLGILFLFYIVCTIYPPNLPLFVSH